MSHLALGKFALPELLMVSAVFGLQTAHANQIYAGACGTPNQPTIQKAVNAVTAGGTVKVCPGTYPEQVLITKNLNLTGVGNGNGNAAVITAPAAGVQVNASDLYTASPLPVAAQVLVQNAGNVNISNITVDGAGNLINGCAPDLRGIYYQNASGSLSSVATRNQILAAGLTGCQSGEGIFVQSSYTGGSGHSNGYGPADPTANVSIQNSSVHTFQKNGITVDGPWAFGNVNNNFIAGQGPTTGAAENGIQISDGAGASVTNNVVIDDIWAPDTSTDTGDAASGILIYASENVLVQNNSVGTTQFGIVTVTGGAPGTPNNPQGLGDHTTIVDNQVLNTQLFDAIDACSNGNTIAGNSVFNSTESGIHLDGSCGSTGNGNFVVGNVINEACAGILAGGSENVGGFAADNAFFNVVNTTLSGNVCPAAPSAVSAAARARVSRAASGGVHPSPAR